MTTIMWTECRNGHALTDPANVYVTPAGHRRCRTCKRMSDRRCRPERTPLMRVPNKQPVRPNRYRTWAEQTWQGMSDRDRTIVGYALGYVTLEQAVG